MSGMAVSAGKSFLMDRYLDELKRMEEEQKQKESGSEVQVLKEQLRRLSAEMISLRQALGLHQRPPPASCPAAFSGGCQRHTHNNPDSGYSDNVADSASAASSFSSASSTASSSSTVPPSSTSVSCSCSCPSVSISSSSSSQMTSRVTADLYGRLDDLMRLPQPAGEEGVCHVLQKRWQCGECMTRLGPILLALNPQRGPTQDRLLECGQAGPHHHYNTNDHTHLQRLVQHVHSQLVENQRPQAVILSGESGSGKTYTSQLFLRQLHSLRKKKPPGVGGGGGGSSCGADQREDKQFRNLVAAFHVLRAVGCAKTKQNSSASRVGHHIEVQLAGNMPAKAKIQCHWFDQSRLVNTPAGEQNFHVFYQMLAGLTHEERAKLHLHGYGPHNLAYLKGRGSSEDAETDKQRFSALRSSLSALGIEFSDVMRILAAILLLGNVRFVEDGGYELDIEGKSEIKAVASLLGVSGVSLYRALTTRTQSIKGQAVKTLCNAEMANQTRDILSKALYCRMVLTVVKRINSVFKQSVKCPPYVAPSISSEDTQSSGDSCSRLSDSTFELAGSAAPVEGSRHTDGEIHIIDMPGFSNSQCNRLEDLSANIGSELLHQHYLQQVFKQSQQAALEDALIVSPISFVDNSPCLELCTLKGGLLSTINAMCNQSERQTAEAILSKVKRRHYDSRLFGMESENRHLFTITHTSGEVRYSAADFLERSRDVISDDVVAIFRRKGCNFGFATHLFAQELKLVQGNVARGLLFRICPRPPLSGGEGRTRPSDASIGSLPSDCHHRLRELLDSLTRQNADFHFIQCIKINDQQDSGNHFSVKTVLRQMRAFQVISTLRHMTDGYPHYLAIADFVKRYFVMLQPRDRRIPPREQCRVILDQIMRRCELIGSGSSQNKWLLSDQRVFYSQETRQALESVREGHRDTSARFLQSKVRCWLARRHWPSSSTSSSSSSSDIQPYSEFIHRHPTKITFCEPVYERIHLPSSDGSEESDSGSIEHKKARMQSRVNETVKDIPPPLPSNHPTRRHLDLSKGFPHTRIMGCDYSPDSSCTEPVLREGEPILVMGVSSNAEMLIVEHNNCTLQVPLKLTLMQTGDCILGTRL
ncbi:unconventional myosin-X-like [Diadema antillarum]|uniref:unconventional myosin-X-like n=1 Tax=Diadema antillarum TaxID=105358 RepID=UPI003A879E09